MTTQSLPQPATDPQGTPKPTPKDASGVPIVRDSVAARMVRGRNGKYPVPSTDEERVALLRNALSDWLRSLEQTPVATHPEPVGEGDTANG